MPLLDHVGIKVTDLDRSVKFYQDVFGFEALERRRIGPDTDSVALKVGVNLILLLHHPGYTTRNPEDPAGVDHFALSFDGAEWERLARRTREWGVRFWAEYDRVQGATGWGPCQYILDPDGTQIEIKQA